MAMNSILVTTRFWKAGGTSGGIGYSFRPTQSRRKVFFSHILNPPAHHHHYHHHHDFRCLCILSLRCPSSQRLPRCTEVGGGGWLYSAQQCRSFSIAPPKRTTSRQSKNKVFTVSDTLDDFMLWHEKLKPHQVAEKWKKLEKSIQQSSEQEQQRFWIDHKASLQMLIGRTIQSSNEFDGRSTVTVTQNLVTILNLTNAMKKKKLAMEELQSLWNALLLQTILLIKSDHHDALEAQDISDLLCAYANAVALIGNDDDDDDGIQKIVVDGRLLNALAVKAEHYLDKFGSNELSNIMWAFAALNHEPPPSLVHAISSIVAEKGGILMDDFIPLASQSRSNDRHLRPPLKATQDGKISERPRKRQSRVSDTLDDYMQRRHDSIKSFQLPTVWNELWKAVERSSIWERQNLRVDHKVSFQTLVDQTIESVVDFDGRCTATVTHSLAKLLHLTNSNLGEFQSLWSALLERTRLLLIQSDGFDARHISNLIWAYAKVDGFEIDGTLLNAIASKAELDVHEFAPQGLSNVAWGFTALNHKAPLLFDAIAGAAPLCMHDFKPQELSNIMIAYAKINHQSPEMFDVIAKASQKLLGDFKPQAFSNMVWSFATLNHGAPYLFDAIAQAAPMKIDDFNPQELSNIIMAYAKMNHKSSPHLFDAIANASQKLLDDFKPQAFSNMVWSFATLNYSAPSLFDAIAKAAQENIDEFNSQALSNTAWAFAMLNHSAPSLFEAIAQAVLVRIDEFNPQEFSTIAWSFVVLNIEPNSFIHMDSPFARNLRLIDPSICTVEQLCQLHQLHLWFKEQNKANLFPDELIQRCREAFTSANAEPSRLHKDVVQSLGLLQDVSHIEVEVQTEIGYSLDIVIVYRGDCIGMEIDGPSHFVGQSQSPNGKMILKHRQLRSLEGLNIVSIPYWEWDNISNVSGGDSKRKEEKQKYYLQNLLNNQETQ